MAAIVESSDDAIISKNLEGQVTSWNPAAEQMFGYAGAEMVGQSILRIIPSQLHEQETAIPSRLQAGEAASSRCGLEACRASQARTISRFLTAIRWLHLWQKKASSGPTLVIFSPHQGHLPRTALMAR